MFKKAAAWLKNNGKAVTKEAAGDVVIAGGVALIFEAIKAITQHVSSHATERVKAKYQEMDALRAMLARALMGLSQEDKEHLYRRLREARKIPGKEDRIVADICAILKDDGVEKGSESAKTWLEGLRKLNAVSDEEFEIILYVAENDRGAQYVERVFREAIEVAKFAGRGSGKLAKEGLMKLDSLTPALKDFNDWLEENLSDKKPCDDKESES